MSKLSITALAALCLCVYGFEARTQQKSQLQMEAAEAEPAPAGADPRIVDGALVRTATQRRLGLVAVGNGCSGTLLTRRWVLTADHCVAVGGAFGGTPLPFASLPITAVWAPGATATPTRYVRFFNTDGLDVALIELGCERDTPGCLPANADLGPIPETRQIITSQVPNGAELRKYGRGIFAYAVDNPAPTPDVQARSDGRYRTADFNVSSSLNGRYTLEVNELDQVGNGGDSGGPDFLLEDERPTKIVGVQSTCRWTGCVAGQTCPPAPGTWFWVTRIRSCNSVQLFGIRQRIIETVFCNGVPGCAESIISQILLLR